MTNAATPLNAPELLASIKNQARRAVYDERDDSVHFEAHHYVKNVAIRQRILIERAVIRRAVQDILAADSGAYCVSVYDGEAYPVKSSRDLAEIMANVGECDDEYLMVRHTRDADGKVGAKVGQINLIYGNDGWDVVSDYTASPLIDGMLAESSRLADILSSLK